MQRRRHAGQFAPLSGRVNKRTHEKHVYLYTKCKYSANSKTTAQINVSVCKRSNYTLQHTSRQKETPTPCGCDPMTLLSHTVPICHREAQREATEQRERLDFQGLIHEWIKTGEEGLERTAATWEKTERKKRTCLHGKFFTYRCGAGEAFSGF